jgi:hypothetical protein
MGENNIKKYELLQFARDVFDPIATDAFLISWLEDHWIGSYASIEDFALEILQEDLALVPPTLDAFINLNAWVRAQYQAGEIRWCETSQGVHVFSMRP